MNKKNIKKRIVCIALCCIVAFGSFFGSYSKSYASISVATGIAFAGMIALCGVAINQTTPQQINMTGTNLFYEYSSWQAENGPGFTMPMLKEFINNAAISGTFSSSHAIWQSIKLWVAWKFYEKGIIGGGTTVEDNRPDITEFVRTGHEAFTKAYLNTKEYPYYLVWGADKFNTINGTFAMCFKTVPLLYYEEESLVYMRADGASDKYPLNGFSYYRYKSSGSMDKTTDLSTVPNEFTIKSYAGTVEEFVAGLTGNIPVFDSREAALGWWNDNVIDGVLSPGIGDHTFVKIPDGVCDDVYDRDGTLENYDVVGGDSYVDEDGKVKTGTTVIPGIGVLTGLGTGALTWDDVLEMTGDKAIDKAQDGTIEGATDLTTGLPFIGSLPKASDIKSFKVVRLKNVFPFCIPFDLIDAVKMFKAEPKAPHFEWKMSFKPLVNYTHTFVIDLSGFESLAIICRTLFTIIFCVGLGFVTRNLIRG